jgi:hypothetical protein
LCGWGLPAEKLAELILLANIQFDLTVAALVRDDVIPTWPAVNRIPQLTGCDNARESKYRLRDIFVIRLIAQIFSYELDNQGFTSVSLYDGFE